MNIKKIGAFARKNHKLLIDILILVLIIIFLFSYFQPQYMFSLTTTTGGDTASHYYYAQFLKDNLIPQGRTIGWVMGNYAGFPVFQFYFPLPFIFMVLFSYIIPLQIMFKLGSVLGIFLLPICAYSMFRSMRFKFPVSAIGAMFTLAFLFHEGNSMWGGNIPSTLAGEFSYSLGLALLLLFLGLIYKHIDTKKGIVATSIVLFLVGISHVYTLLIAVVAPLFLLITKKHFVARLKYLKKVYVVAFLLLGSFIIPMVSKLAYTTSYSDKWYISSIWRVFPKILIPFAVLTIVSVVLIFVFKSVRDDSRIFYLLFTILISFIFYINALKLHVVDIRFIPFIQLFICLVSAFMFYVILKKLKALWIVPFVLLFVTLFWVKANVTYINHWIPWNYGGFESKSPWDNYADINSFLAGDENDPRVVFEHNQAHNAFGSSRAFESLPHFSGRSTLEGLYMQSSLNSPHIFYIQSLVSQQQSCPFPNFGCANTDFEEAVPYLEMFNVKELIMYTDYAKNLINQNENYQKLETFDKYEIWELKQDEYNYVYVPEFKPVPVTTDNFQLISFLWFVNQSQLSQPLVNDFNFKAADRAYFNPATISGISELENLPKIIVDNNCSINEKISQEKIEFTTDCIGKPHIIKITYFPNWKVKGASGVYQASPSFMLVVPNQNNVTIYYGKTAADNIGLLFSVLGVLLLVLFSLKNKKIKKILSLDFFNPVFKFMDRYKIVLLVIAILLVVFITISDIIPRSVSEHDELRTQIAVATSKYSVCEHAGAMRNLCYIEVGKKTGDYNLCTARISDQKTKDLCYKEIAIAQNDSNLCKNWIKDEVVKAECLEALEV